MLLGWWCILCNLQAKKMESTSRTRQKKRAADPLDKVGNKARKTDCFDRGLNLKADDDAKTIWWREKNTHENDDVTSRRVNWLDMPNKVMNLIFLKLGTVWVLGVAQYVCSLWQKLSKQPVLYRSVGIHDRDLEQFHMVFHNTISIGGLARLAFDRGCGQTLQFSCSSMQYFYPGHLESLSACVSLRSLKLGNCGQIGIHKLTSVIKKFTSLEQLYLFNGRDTADSPKDIIVDIGHTCRKLKYLRIGNFGDSAALVIAENMPGLHRLHLNGNSLTIHGFQAILNACPHLEYLRVGGTSNLLDVDAASLKKQLTRIKNITRILTNGRTFDEYEFDIEQTGTTHSDVSDDYTPFQDELDIQAYYG